MENSIAFAFMIDSPADASAGALLAESVRAFGGRLSPSPVWALLPDDAAALPERAARRMAGAHVEVVRFSGHPAVAGLPFSGKVLAAAKAESLASGMVEILVWMDVGSLVLQEPSALLLPGGVSLGYRPVDLALIGSPAAERPDRFWEALYAEFGIDLEEIPTMITSVDRQEIRAYWNAGLLAVRPERGLLRRWAQALLRLAPTPAFSVWLADSPRHRVFFHQAVLAGTILMAVPAAEMVELPRRISYPLHLHTRYPVDARPRLLNELVTCRAESFFSPGWQDVLPAEGNLAVWLESRLGAV